MTYSETSTAALPECCVECGQFILQPCTFLLVPGKGSFHIDCAERHGYVIVPQIDPDGELGEK